MRGHQPGSQPIDIPEAIPNPVLPRPHPAPPPTPNEQPVFTPEPLSPERTGIHVGFPVRAHTNFVLWLPFLDEC